MADDVASASSSRLLIMPASRNNKHGRNGLLKMQFGCNTQRKVINRTIEILGSSFWDCGHKSGTHCKEIKHVLQECQKLMRGYRLSYSTHRRWMIYYIQFGEVPAQNRRDRKTTIRGIRASKTGVFTEGDEAVLKSIIEEECQLYLDEIQERLFEKTGKVWATSTIWSHMHNLNYSLKVAIHRASQQDEVEVNAFHSRMQDAITHPNQCVFIDESSKSANA